MAYVSTGAVNIKDFTANLRFAKGLQKAPPPGSESGTSSDPNYTYGGGGASVASSPAWRKYIPYAIVGVAGIAAFFILKGGRRKR